MEEIYYLMNSWWEGVRPDVGIPRPDYLARLKAALDRNQVELIMGGRRVGKTTLLRQVALHCLDSGLPAQDILYLALDHPRLAGTPISEHLRRFRTLFDHPRARRLCLLLDEVQESPVWEAELKALYDLENLKLFCTGSTGALLESQGGKLTGRQALLVVYPLSFREFLSFRGLRFSRAEDYRFVAACDDYLEIGGYPENVLRPSQDYLAQLLDDVLARDLVRLWRIRRPELVGDLVRLLAAGVGTRTSYNRLSRALGISLDTVKDYISHLRQAYLVGTLEKWTTSPTERVFAQRKIYFLDTGFKTALTGPRDRGARAENAVFLDLVRRGIPCGYYAESDREVDFVAGPADDPTVIEVKHEDAFDPSDRRLKGVRLFLRRYPTCKRVTVVTRSAFGEARAEAARIEATPLWRFLLRE